MKIIGLRVNNLHSLKGKFFIDFTHPALAEAGIFAITGPTGAGKSTLLDAITLALYSYTPRLEAISKEGIQQNNILVTQGTSEAYAELEFEVNQQKYLANWSISKNRNGNWNDYKHQVSKENAEGRWELLSDKKSDTKIKINSIIGLTKDQFSKAIVLSQGKFDDFLLAPANERYKLLEIITGTSLYREIGKRVFEKYKEAKEAYALQQSKISHIQLLTDTEITEFEQQLKQIILQVADIDNEIKVTAIQRDSRNELEKINARINQLSSALTDLAKEEVAFVSTTEKLENYEKALRIKPEYTEWVTTGQLAEEQKKKITRTAQEIEQLSLRQNACITELALIVKKEISHKNFISELNTFVKIVSALDAEIDLLKSNTESEKAGNRGLIGTLPSSLQTQVKSLLGQNPEALEGWIHEQKNHWLASLPTGVASINYLKSQIAEHQNKSGILKELRFPADQIPQLRKKYLESERIKNELEADIEQLKKSMQQVSDLLLQEEKELQLLEDEWKRYQEIHQLENVRKDLQVGQPCPCCGSTHHPYLLHMPAISSLIETQVLEKKKTVTSLREQKLTTEDNIKERVISIRNTIREIEQNQQDSANLLNQVTQLLQQVSLTQLPTIQELNQQLAETDQQAEQLSSALLWAEKEETMFNIFQGAKKYISTLDQLRSKEEKRKQLFNNHPVEAIRETLQNAWLVAETELISANKNSLTLKEEEEKLQHRLSNQITQLQKAYGLAGFASLEEVQAALVADSLANEWKQQKAGLEKRKIEFNTELNARNLEQVAVAGTIDVNFDRLNLDELLGVLNNQKAEILENRGKITQQLKDNETALQTQASMRAVLEKLQQRSQLFLSLNSLIGDAGGDTFNKIVQRITLKHLLSRANVEMKKLMDRYQLLMVDNKEKNEDQIWVSDLFMGNENRSINSVSGGERFVISLALALALSDMASQNIRIDSLFIDEGFGSLSPDELNNAIQMLERMQLEGNKMLGIISHVESLKERITTQLVVEKIGPGESTLFLSTPEMKISLHAQK